MPRPGRRQPPGRPHDTKGPVVRSAGTRPGADRTGRRSPDGRSPGPGPGPGPGPEPGVLGSRPHGRSAVPRSRAAVSTVRALVHRPAPRQGRSNALSARPSRKTRPAPCVHVPVSTSARSRTGPGTCTDSRSRTALQDAPPPHPRRRDSLGAPDLAETSRADPVMARRPGSYSLMRRRARPGPASRAAARTARPASRTPPTGGAGGRRRPGAAALTGFRGLGACETRNGQVGCPATVLVAPCHVARLSWACKRS